jgi:quercetin dioxygenase-like cupin family protein
MPRRIWRIGCLCPEQVKRIYVLEGSGTVILDGVEHPVSKGSLVHIPPGVVHGARGRVRVLVVGIPDIAEDDYFEAPQQQ